MALRATIEGRLLACESGSPGKPVVQNWIRVNPGLE